MIEDPEIEALLEAVANRAQVDSERADDRDSNPERRARLRALHDVARLAEFHRMLQRDSAPAGGRGIERWGGLLLLERVAAGAGGEVHRAWDPALQREVALKLVSAGDGAPADAADWLEEARALARVRDPHVVTVFGAAEHEGRAGLWMEFLHGPTLEQEIARAGALPPAEVARLGAQIGRALRAVHAAGTIHRDVKPANIVLESAERAVLTDFGLGQRRSAGRSTRPFSGTPLFMSPQRLAGAAAKPADDLYALGVTLWWALAGKPPFRADTLDGLRAEVARGPERPLAALRPEAPRALVAAIEGAMTADAEARFGSAGELVAGFEAALGRVGAGAPAVAAPARRGGSRAVLGISAGLAAAAALMWLAVARLPRREAPPATVAPAPVARAYDVSAGFVRRGRDGDARLETGDRVSPGDRLSLEFRSSRPVWVYVLDSDERGESYLLFPQPMFDRGNPVPGDSTILLPGTRGGRENAWTVTSRGGREHLMVVADPAPVAELEAELARLPAPVPNAPIRYARVGEATMERLRGMGGVSEVPKPGPRPDAARAFERIRALAGREQGVHGTWVRQVVLENPLR